MSILHGGQGVITTQQLHAHADILYTYMTILAHGNRDTYIYIVFNRPTIYLVIISTACNLHHDTTPTPHQTNKPLLCLYTSSLHNVWYVYTVHLGDPILIYESNIAYVHPNLSSEFAHYYVTYLDQHYKTLSHTRSKTGCLHSTARQNCGIY